MEVLDKNIKLLNEFEVREYSYLWTIKNANDVIRENRHSSSGYFTFGCLKEYNGNRIMWKLIFDKPSENEWWTMKINNYRPSFIHPSHNEARLKIDILNYKNSFVLYSNGPITMDIQSTSSFIYENYVLNSDLKSYVIDDTLKFHIQMSFSTRELVYSNGSSVKNPNFVINNNQLASDFSSFLSDEEFADLMIQTSTGEMKAHKTILAARSPVFHSMLTSQMLETIESRIVIPDFSCGIVSEMLNFIYSGTLSFGDKNMETLGELFKISHKYQLDELRKYCSKIIGSRMDLENVVEIFTISNFYEEKTLKDKACLFIKTNMKNLAKTQDFKNLKTSDPQIIADIFFALIEY